MTRRVVCAENLFDYFHLRVEDARSEHRVRISDDTSLYLASLLAERARQDRPSAADETLAELHLHAANAPPVEQARRYRELGDRALYTLGYFADAVDRSIVGPRYYADMGSAAYSRADRLFKQWLADAFGPVFGELAERFEECVALVGDVKEAGRDVREDDPVWLCERYLATGQEAYGDRLRELGVLIVKRPDGDSGEE